MATHIIIDGYNLLFSSGLVEQPGGLEELREELLGLLKRYQAARPHRMTVVFDGTRGARDSSERRHGGRLRVVFSRRGETADDVIVKRVARLGPETVVVSSDRAVRDAAEARGCVAVASEEFALRVLEALSSPAGEPPVEDEEAEPTLSTRKRGNPRRASRKERRRSKRLDKL